MKILLTMSSGCWRKKSSSWTAPRPRTPPPMCSLAKSTLKMFIHALRKSKQNNLLYLKHSLMILNQSLWSHMVLFHKGGFWFLPSRHVPERDIRQVKKQKRKQHTFGSYGGVGSAARGEWFLPLRWGQASYFRGWEGGSKNKKIVRRRQIFFHFFIV